MAENKILELEQKLQLEKMARLKSEAELESLKRDAAEREIQMHHPQRRAEP